MRSQESILRKQLWQRIKQFAFPYRNEKLGILKFVLTFCFFAFKNFRKIFKLIFKHLYLCLEKENVRIVEDHEWQSGLELQRSQNLLAYQVREEMLFFPKKPLISLILTLEDRESRELQETLDSIRGQYNPHWELCVATTEPEMKKWIESYTHLDPRIKIVIIPSGTRVLLWNAAFASAEGLFITWIEPKDTLAPEALYEVVRKINIYPELELLYTDEDLIDPKGGFYDPFFKPDWSAESFLSRNYLRYLVVVKKEIALEAGLLQEGFKGAEHYEFLLRITELTEQIFHIPKSLYHARKRRVEKVESGRIALEKAMKRRNLNVTIDPNLHCQGCYTLHYHAKTSHKVSIIIPTKDHTLLLKRCLDSLYAKTSYPHMEVFVVSNNSSDPKLFELLKAYRKEKGDHFIYYESNQPFNYSHLMNEAVARTSGDMLLFLNNDTEIITAEWIDEMVGVAEQSDIGVVGCKLLYPNDTIQHAGLVLGLKTAFCVHAFLSEPATSPGYFNQLNTMNNYSALTAACFLCSKEHFLEVGGFDEELKSSFNDIDFCLKLREKGLRNVYLPHVQLYHHECMTRGLCSSTKHKSAQFFAEQERMRARWPLYCDYDPCYSIHLCKKGSFRP